MFYYYTPEANTAHFGKHIVALLLTFLNQPEVFTERKSVDSLLSGVEKEALGMIIARLLERNPDLYDDLEMAILAIKSVQQVQLPDSIVKSQTLVSEQAYRKQVKRLLKQSRYEDHEYGSPPAYLDDLEDIRKTAVQFLDAGDPDGALIIFRVLLEETVNDYESEADYDGDVAAFIQDLGMPLAETILSVEMDDSTRQVLQVSLEDIFEDLDESIEESELDVVSAALEYAWKDLPDEETQWEEHDEETWMLFAQLQQARLNVLERQGLTDEFLKLAKNADTKRYILKLLQLEKVDDAVAASREIVDEYAILSVAQALGDAGRLNDAIALAERGLSHEGHYRLELAAWLAPLEEARGES